MSLFYDVKLITVSLALLPGFGGLFPGGCILCCTRFYLHIYSPVDQTYRLWSSHPATKQAKFRENKGICNLLLFRYETFPLKLKRKQKTNIKKTLYLYAEIYLSLEVKTRNERGKDARRQV